MIRSADRLYLSQGEKNIYIENSKIPPHHIEGIRFLYRQFERKKPGVIINDPYSYGRKLQVILFLKAIRQLLNKPVLILCKEEDEYDWVDRFHTWTDLYDDVVVNMTNLSIKKMILINTMVNLPMYCRHEWSIVVIDSDKDHFAEEILQIPFKADFKIWCTPVNLKENLDKFTEIYNWVYPYEIFDKCYFIPNADNPVDIIEKSVLLDSFLEDIVIRRDDLHSSFEKYQRDLIPFDKNFGGVNSKSMPMATATMATDIPSTVTSASATSLTAPVLATPSAATPGSANPPLVSRKNKDPTGTKVKRSKKRIESTEPAKETQPAPTTLIADIPIPSETFASNEDFSIDNYNRKFNKNYEQSTNERKESQVTGVGISDSQSDMKLYYDTDYSGQMSSRHNLVAMDTLSFGADPYISQECNVNVNKRKRSESDDAGPSFEEHLNIPNKQQILAPKDNNNITSTSTSKTTDAQQDDSKMNLEALNREINYLRTKEISPEQIKCNKSSEDELKQRMYEVNKKSSYSGAYEMSFKDDKNKVHTKDNNEADKSTSEAGTKESTERVTNILKRNNVDDKMKEYEEKLTKKFKGSFLDNLF